MYGFQLTPDGKPKPGVAESESSTPPPNPIPSKKEEHLDDEESFFDLLSRFQSERMDDQRCSLSIADKENRAVSTFKNDIQKVIEVMPFKLKFFRTAQI